MGYCFGGFCALDLARATPPLLRAVVGFHDVLKTPNLGPQPPIGASILLLEPILNGNRYLELRNASVRAEIYPRRRWLRRLAATLDIRMPSTSPPEQPVSLALPDSLALQRAAVGTDRELGASRTLHANR